MNKASSSMGVVLIALLVMICLTGCTGNIPQPIFGPPDSVVVTTLREIQGKPGYFFELSGGEEVGTTTEVVLGIADQEVSPHPFYILVRDAADTPEGAAIRRLHGATHAGFAREVPQGYVLLGTKEVEIDIRLGQNTPTYSNTLYFFCTTQKGHKVYFPICLTFDDVAYRKFWEIVNAGAKVIDTGDDSTDGKTGDETDFVTWLSAPLDPTGGPSPAYITEVTHISSDGVETSINKVRENQEKLVRATYGNEYYKDPALQRALRIVDRIDERFRLSWIVYLADQNRENRSKTRDAILRWETGLHYFTLEFTWHGLKKTYERAVGGFPNTSYGLYTEHLRLHFTYPNEGKDQLLSRLYHSAANGLIVTENPWSK